MDICHSCDARITRRACRLQQIDKLCQSDCVATESFPSCLAGICPGYSLEACLGQGASNNHFQLPGKRGAAKSISVSRASKPYGWCPSACSIFCCFWWTSNGFSPFYRGKLTAWKAHWCTSPCRDHGWSHCRNILHARFGPGAFGQSLVEKSADSRKAEQPVTFTGHRPRVPVSSSQVSSVSSAENTQGWPDIAISF
mmetsp:Transcript_14763/g.27723  ORF Transcript_14763/g.27723 Transcript_14763/m.27723 type:complete len:197 (-) Transcript_14763:656-1246(-)